MSVPSAALPWFALEVAHMRLDKADPTTLDADPEGPIWHVGQTDSAAVRQELWGELSNPETFHQ